MSDQLSGKEDPRPQSAVARMTEIANAVDVANSLAVPIKKGIDDLLQFAAESVGSAVASVLVTADDDGTLKFLTATSGVSDELLALRLPPGAGIAGLVFSTTQPMAVSDVSQEGSFWSEADRRTGFKTVTLLATPLRANGEMVGVLEFVNRPGEPPYHPFTPAEMDSASRFADAIALLVDAYQMAQLVESLFNYSIKTSSTHATHGDRESEVREWIAQTPASAEHRDLLLLWVSLREIVIRGGAERELCRNLLDVIAKFTKAQSGGSSFGF
jgi:signal transduction protein with GAF and PtsI domain